MRVSECEASKTLDTGSCQADLVVKQGGDGFIRPKLSSNDKYYASRCAITSACATIEGGQNLLWWGTRRRRRFDKFGIILKRRLIHEGSIQHVPSALMMLEARTNRQAPAFTVFDDYVTFYSGT